MKFVLVTGLEEIDKKAVVEFVLRGFRDSGFTSVSLEDIPEAAGVQALESFDEIKKTQSRFYTKLEKNVISAMRKGKGNVILSGCITKKTKHGYMPLITDDFFDTFKPDVIISMELDPRTITRDPKKLEDIKNHQDLNRHYNVLFSSKCGSMLRVINVDLGNITKAVREISEIIRNM